LYSRPSDVNLTGAATKTSVSLADGFRHVVYSSQLPGGRTC
jgi:hypothetical protein